MPSYTINFPSAFDNVPKMVTTCRGIQNCPANKNQYLSLYYNSPILTTTNCVMQLYLLTAFGYDPNITVRVYSLAYDPVYNANIQARVVIYPVSTLNSSTTVTFTSGKLDLATTYKGCFLLAVDCYSAPSTFRLENGCTVLDPTTIQFNTNTTANLLCVTWNSIFLVLIVYSDNDNTLTITSGTLTATAASSSPLSLDPAQPSSLFLIGLTSFETSDGCLNISLNPNNIEVDSASSFNEISYDYLQVVYKLVDFSLVITSRPFADKVVFEYSTASYSVPALPLPTFSPALTYNSTSPNTVTANVVAPIGQAPVVCVLYLDSGINVYKTSTPVQIITAASITNDVMNNLVDIQLINVPGPATASDFTLNNAGFTKNSVAPIGSNTNINFKYDKAVIGSPFSLSYTSPDGQTQGEVEMYLPTVSGI